MLILTAANLEAEGVKHCFFGREDGVSGGIFASLNCGPGSGDRPDNVIRNRARAVQALRPDAALVTLYQVHSAHAVVVDAPWAPSQSPHADAMATNRRGIALGVLTADCAPVLFCDAEAGVVAAAHAGWKGALAGVTDAALAAMEGLGATRAHIAAAIGPCIGRERYEVGAEFRQRFVQSHAPNSRFFAPAACAERFLFDLAAYVALRLQEAGVTAIERLSACTYAQESKFFSYRRATHRGEADYGRQLSAIMLT